MGSTSEYVSDDSHNIKNLEHEFVHYLDARYNLAGDFNDAGGNANNTIWWTEGLANYISEEDSFDSAIALARTKEFSLSTIFTNTYDDSQERVYRWSYLAVRFFFERHPIAKDIMLTYLRNGQYEEFSDYVSTLRIYDNEWFDWLEVVQSNDEGSKLFDGIVAKELSADKGEYIDFHIDVPAETKRLVVGIGAVSGDPDIYVREGAMPTDDIFNCRPANGGSYAEKCTMYDPKPGRWFIRVKAFEAFNDITMYADNYDFY